MDEYGEAADQQRTPGVDFVITSDAILRSGVEESIASSTSVDCHDLHNLIQAACESASGEKKAVLQFFSGLTNYFFKPLSKAEPFAAMMAFEDWRTLVPTDYLPDQEEQLAVIAPVIKNLGLRARVADVSWFLKRSRSESGFLAVKSYCDIVLALGAGVATLAHGQTRTYSRRSIDLVERAAVISQAMGWQRPEFDCLRQVISQVSKDALKDEDPHGFLRIAKVGLDRNVGSPSDIAASAEKLIRNDTLKADAESRRQLWELAARAYRFSQNESEVNRCWLAATECIVEKSTEAADSAMRRAAFLQEAIQYLRTIPGTQQRRQELHDELRSVQPSINDKMGTFSHEIDLTQMVEHAQATVVGRSLPRALLELVVCDRISEPGELHAEAMTQLEEHPISSLMATTVHDHQGRVVFKSPGWGRSESDNAIHLKFLIARIRDISRKIAVSGAIEPIRRTITSEHPVTIDDIYPLMADSPFVPPGHELIFARGFQSFLAGEDLAAAHILIPQVENSLRHVLALKGTDTTTTDQFGIQSEATLSMLLDRYRQEIERILTPRFVAEIDLLLNFRGGPSIRNELAHGKMQGTAFWGHNVVYANWLVMHLVLLPLGPHWEEVERMFAARSRG